VGNLSKERIGEGEKKVYGEDSASPFPQKRETIRRKELSERRPTEGVLSLRTDQKKQLSS